MHGTFPLPEPAPRRAGGITLAFRLALRDLRAGLSGFAVFIACIALGVAAIAGISSTASSLVAGVTAQGRVILGGDIALALIQRQASPEEMAFLRRQGSVSAVATLRAMVNAGEKGAALVEAKAVDAAYPAVGAVATEPARPLADLLSARDGAYGAVVDPGLLDRLGLALGDSVTIGASRIDLGAILRSEPDKIATGIGFGPRLLLSQAALDATKLIQPGSLVRWTYRIVLPPDRNGDADVERSVAAIEKAFPEAGWEIRSRLNADPRFRANIERFSQFLSLVGLTALLVGGVGVANAVTAFVDRKRISIGILKSLGATGSLVLSVYLIQVVLIACLGIAIGLVIGATMPFAAAAALASALPVPINAVVAPAQLATAAGYGLLVALAFSLPPLARARALPVTGLFRDRVAPTARRPDWRIVAVTTALAALLVLFAVLTSFDRRVALIFATAAVAAFLCLRATAAGLMAAARRLPATRLPFLRLAIANLHRPGALTPSLVLSLGLGITLLVTLATIDGNLTREITRTLPAHAPNLFFIDVPSSDDAAFRAFLAEKASGSAVEDVPMMRGRLLALGGRSVADVKAAPDAAWVLDGDRGITFSDKVPEGSTLEAGEWWPADYAGPPLVSFDGDLARGLGLNLGDSITVNVLGRSISAQIASLRKVEWRRMGINFVMVFSPNTFRGAPHTALATLTLPASAAPDAESRLLRDVASRFPAVTSVRVKDALDAVNDIVSQLLLAIRVASSVALAASLLVLAGALAAGHRARIYDAVILKTLGATRAGLVGAYLMEYGALGVATGLFGPLAGTAAGFAVVSGVMHLGFTPAWPGALLSAALAVFVSVVLGLAGTWRILGQKPASFLRER